MKKTMFVITVAILIEIQSLYAQQIENDSLELRNLILPVLLDRDFINIPQPDWNSSQLGSIKLSNEDFRQMNGLFRQEKITADASTDNVPRVFIDSQSNVRLWETLTITPDEKKCHSIGESFLRRHYQWVFTEPNYSVSTQPPTWNTSYGKATWNFKWLSNDNEGLPQTEALVRVRAFDGKVVGFSVRKHNWPKHNAPYSAVKKTISDLVSKEGKAKDLEFGYVAVFDPKFIFGIKAGVPSLLYRVVIAAKDKTTNRPRRASLYADANTGKIIWIDEDGNKILPTIPWQSVKTKNENDRNILGAWSPAVTKSGLLFAANLNLLGMPEWIPATGQIFLRSSDEKGIRFVTSDLSDGHSVRAISALPNSNWLAVNYTGGWSYAINLETAEYHILGNPDRPAYTPTVDAQGRWGVVSATGRTGNEDSDLFFKKLDDVTQLGIRTRIIIPKSDEQHPIFSLDGKSLYFISETEKASELCRISTDFLKEGEPLQPTTKQLEKYSTVLPSGVRKISIFASGKKLLLDTYQKPLIFDLVTKKIQSIEIKKMTDIELAGAPITWIKDVEIVAGQDGEIIFCGETTDSKKVTRLRLYAYNLATNSLKPLSPANSKAFAPHVFTNSKESVFSLDKAIALSEIAWEEKRPKNFTE